MAILKDSRAQSRLEKAARERANAGVHFEVEAIAIREKTARLRALRIAKETADKSAAVGEGAVLKEPVTKRSVKSMGESTPPASPVDRSKGGLPD
jgi:hypothetical protein